MSGLINSNGRFSGWLLAAALLLLATGAQAGPAAGPAGAHQNSAASAKAEPWPPAGPLTMEQAVRRALECDSRIASLKAAVEIAHEQRLAATDIKDPVLQAESRSGGSDSASSDDLDNSRLAVGVFVPNPWLTIPRVDARAADYQAAQADLNAAVWLLKSDISRLFAQLEFLTNDLAYSADRVRLEGDIFNAVQARVGQGAAIASDLMTASRQSIQFSDDLDQSLHRYQLARRQLAALLNAAPDAFDPATNQTTLPALPASGLAFQEAETLADKSRWDLAALRWRSQAAKSAYHEIRNEKVPWIKEVKAGYLDNSQNNSDKYWVGVTMDIPIFSWIKNHAGDAVLAKANLASVDETNGLNLVRQELHDALDELDQTRRQQNRYDTTVSPMVATMRQTLATLKGTPNIMPEQVAAAELQLVETLRFELNARWQYRLALLNLEQTLGAPLGR